MPFWEYEDEDDRNKRAASDFKTLAEKTLNKANADLFGDRAGSILGSFYGRASQLAEEAKQEWESRYQAPVVAARDRLSTTASDIGSGIGAAAESATAPVRDFATALAPRDAEPEEDDSPVSKALGMLGMGRQNGGHNMTAEATNRPDSFSEPAQPEQQDDPVRKALDLLGTGAKGALDTVGSALENAPGRNALAGVPKFLGADDALAREERRSGEFKAKLESGVDQRQAMAESLGGDMETGEASNYQLDAPRSAAMVMGRIGKAVKDHGPGMAKTHGAVAPPPSAGPNVQGFSDEVVRQFFDNAVGLRKIGEQVAGARGAALGFGEDAYKLLRLARGSSAAADQRLEETLGPVVKGLDDQGLHELNMYLKAQDTIDKAASTGNPARNFGGMTAADAQQALGEMQNALGAPKYQALEQEAQRVFQFGHDLLDRKVQAGLVDPKWAAWLKQTFPHYIPINVIDWMEDKASRGVGQAGGSANRLSVDQNGMRQLSEAGTGRAAELPLDAMVRLAHESERLATKNEAAQAFINYFKQDPSLANMIRPANQDAAAFLGTQIAPNRAPGEADFHVFIDGAKHDFWIDKNLERSFNYTGWNLDNPLGKFLSTTADILRKGATGANVAFMLPNAVGDAMTFLVRGGGLKNLPENLGHLAAGYSEAGLNPFKGFKPGADLAEMKKLGGGYAGFFGGEIGAGGKKIADLRGAINTEQQLWHFVKDVAGLKPIQRVGERVESATRVAEFKRAKAHGASPQEAALAARDVTIDFARGGEFARALNGVVPFFNVGFQAPAQVVRAFQDPKTRNNASWGLATMVAAPTVLLEAYNRQDPTYADVPQYDKDRGLIIMDPRGPGPVSPETGRPEPRYGLLNLREWSPFAIAIREVISQFADKDPRSWDEAARAILRGASPVEPGANALFDVMPPPMRVGAELITNYDAFRDKGIIPESMKKLPAEEQYTAKTSETAKALGKLTGKPPAAIEHAVSGLGAGVGRQALAAGDMLLGAAGVTPEPSRRVRQLERELAKTGLPEEKRAILSHELETERTKELARGNSIRAIPVAGGLASTVYREQGGEIERRADKKIDERLQGKRTAADPVAKEMQRLGLNFSDVEGQIGGQRINRRQEGEYRLKALAYRESLMGELVDQPFYRQADDATKSRLAKNAMKRAASWAGQEIAPSERGEGTEIRNPKVGTIDRAVDGYLRGLEGESELEKLRAKRFLGYSGEAGNEVAQDRSTLDGYQRVLGEAAGRATFISKYGARRFARAHYARENPSYERQRNAIERRYPEYALFIESAPRTISRRGVDVSDMETELI